MEKNTPVQNDHPLRGKLVGNIKKKTNQKDKVEVGQSACNYTDMSTERWQYRFFVQVAMTSVSFTICRKYNIFSKYTYREQVHWGTHPSK